ncbi:MAG: glycosyltransferase family 2 protein [Candidatus Andersenbacteria bacterium]
MNAVGAVVVTHNSEDTIADCIRSLLAQKIQSICVVDSASVDSTLDIVREFPVQVVTLDQNRGFGAAANVGSKCLDKPYIIFLNPDAFLASGSIHQAVQYISSHASVAVLGFRLQDTEGHPEKGSYGDAVSLLSLFGRRISKAPIDDAVPLQVGWVSGGAMLVDTGQFRAVGGFDETFFLYWEDVDLCRRIHAKGKSITLYPLVAVTHRRGMSLTDIGRKTYLYDQSADRYFRKHYATSIWLLHRLLRQIYRLFSSRVQ